MKITDRQHLTGVNRWSRERTFAAVVAGVPEGPIPPPLLGALAAALDELPVSPHLAGAGERVRSAVPPGAGWGRGLAELAAELQYLSGEVIGARAGQTTATPGAVRVALECEEFAPADACLGAAVRACTRLLRGRPPQLPRELDALTACASDACLGGATGPIVAAARRRGIPAYRLDAESLVQLGEGARRQHVCTAMTSRTSHVAVRASTDKHLVARLWSRVGIPVAAGRLAEGAEDAVLAAGEVGWPVVTKPGDSDYGRGVSLPLRTDEQVRRGYATARACSASGRVLVQRYLRGASHRLLVVEGRLVSALRRDPVGVLGDGRHTVRELVDRADREGRWAPDRRPSLGERERALLAEAGLTPEAVPAPGVRVALSHDLLEIYTAVTERVHPETRELALDAARVIGLDVAGLDLIALDIGRPLAGQGGGFLEINAQPAIAIHRPPHCDRPQAVAEAIVASLFPPPACGRVPLVVVLGGRRADETAALAAELLGRGGRQVAVSTPQETRWQHRPLAPVSASPADRLAALMLHPRTEAAVLSATWADVLESGLGADQCHVLVLAEGPPAVGGDDGEGVEALLRRLLPAARRAVVNLDDPRAAGCAAAALPASILVSSNPADPRLLQHLATGRVAAFPQEAEVVIRAGEVEPSRFAAATGPGVGGTVPTTGTQALAAAAVYALGVDGSNGSTIPEPREAERA